MRKYLLVSGCSFTTDDYVSLKHPQLACDWPKWPELLGEKLDMPVINVGKSGAGQEYIFSTLAENIVKYGDQIGLVIAAWSQIQRKDYATTNSLGQQKWMSSHIENKGDAIYFMNKSMQYFYMFQLLCEKYNLKYKQFCMIEPWKDYMKDQPIMQKSKHVDLGALQRKFVDNPFYDLIDKKHFIGWPIDNDVKDYAFNMQDLITKRRKIKSLQISDYDVHPNALGHEKYAEFIYENI